MSFLLGLYFRSYYSLFVRKLVFVSYTDCIGENLTLFIPPLPFDQMYIEPHPYLPWVYKKNSLSQKRGPIRYPLHPGRFQIPQLKTNNLRIVNGEDGGSHVSIEKLNGLKRIICLGASTTGNYIEEDGKTFSYPLELDRILNSSEDHKKYEVINFGQGGYNSADLLVRYCLNIADLKPDYLIIYHAYNDVRNYLTGGFDPIILIPVGI